MSDCKSIRRALVSVYDKERLLEIGNALSGAGVEILSTGAQILRLVVNAVVKNMPSSTGDTSHS